MDSTTAGTLATGETGAPLLPTMKAIIRDRYGSADVLRLGEVEVPEVGDEEVLVRVRAAGLERGAWYVMAGLPYLLRGAGYGLRRPKVAGLGSELAGVVEAVGGNGVSSTPKVDLVRSLGADHVIDYTRADITGDGKRYDVVLDIGGNRPLSRLRRVLTSDGTLVIVGGEGGGRWTGGIHRQLGAMVLSCFVRQRLGTFIAKPNSADLDELRVLIEAGSVTPFVDRVITLDLVPDAIRDLTAGRVRGKVIIAT